MTQPARVILFTTDESAAPEFRRQITALPRVKIVAELDEPCLLAQAVSQFPAEVVVVDIDRSTDVVLECVSQLTQAFRDLVVFALSSETGGDIVLRAMRAGVKEYLVKPLKAEEFAAAVARAVTQKTDQKAPGQLISIMGTAGGVGTTTLATNLAVELAGLVGEGGKVAIVDLDFRFGQVATLLDLHGQFTVADLCDTPEQVDPELIEKAVVKHESGLLVLARPHSFAQAETITAAHCASVFTGLQELCDYVVVDGPTRHDPGGRIVLDAADTVLMVLQLLVTSVRSADRMLQELATQGFNTDRISLLCNRMGRESAHLEISHVEQTLNRRIYATVSDDWDAVSSSINVGKPLNAEFGRSKVRREIQELARRFHEPEALAAEAANRSGLLGRFFKKGAKPQAAATEAAAVTTASPAQTKPV
ncbi:MAG: AAA family ATPase [Planctomycetota bacterium]|nr:AAA family ATPase [Planctomycetota bacterium]